MNDKYIIELENVQKKYGNRIVLNDLSLNVPHGVTGLLGPNGSGKSTLIKSILGLIRIDQGRGRVLQFDWPRQTRPARDQIGYLPEDDCYIHGLQGIESIQLMARLSGLPNKEALRRSHEVADFCDIGQERYRNVESYSTGMRQKLKFAQALVHDPPMIILDEPTTGLDPTQRDQFLARIKTLAIESKKSILLSTHILHDVQRVCDFVVIMAAGRVLLADTLENFQSPSEPGIHVTLVSDHALFCEELKFKGIRFEVTAPRQLIVHGFDLGGCQILWEISHRTGIAIQRLDVAKHSLEERFLESVNGGV